MVDALVEMNPSTRPSSNAKKYSLFVAIADGWKLPSQGTE
jgi:hypothetical protein